MSRFSGQPKREDGSRKISRESSLPEATAAEGRGPASPPLFWLMVWRSCEARGSWSSLGSRSYTDSEICKIWMWASKRDYVWNHLCVFATQDFQFCRTLFPLVKSLATGTTVSNPQTVFRFRSFVMGLLDLNLTKRLVRFKTHSHHEIAQSMLQYNISAHEKKSLPLHEALV